MRQIALPPKRYLLVTCHLSRYTSLRHIYVYQYALRSTVTVIVLLFYVQWRHWRVSTVDQIEIF